MLFVHSFAVCWLIRVCPYKTLTSSPEKFTSSFDELLPTIMYFGMFEKFPSVNLSA